MKAGVVVFPGSNCEREVADAIANASGKPAVMLWHRDSEIPKLDLIVLPGGFSYGDYLRTGAMAAHSPVMKSVKEQAQKGVRVLGICNGFQILAEAKMVPGVLRRNKTLKYVCKDIFMRVEANDTPFTSKYKNGQVISYPVGHGEGNYYAPDDTIKQLEDKNLIALRYCNADGKLTDDANPNGSIKNIAGVYNESRNVLGLMPHPDRCADAVLGKTDGKIMFESLVASLS